MHMHTSTCTCTYGADRVGSVYLMAGEAAPLLFKVNLHPTSYILHPTSYILHPTGEAAPLLFKVKLNSPDSARRRGTVIS